MIEFKFRIPCDAWSTNQDRNLNPYVRADRIKLWKEATVLAYRQSRLGALQPGIVQVHIPFRTTRRRDPHNYCGTVVKAVIDGIVVAGGWPDDTPEYVGHREPVLVKGEEVIVRIYNFAAAENN